MFFKNVSESRRAWSLAKREPSGRESRLPFAAGANGQLVFEKYISRLVVLSHSHPAGHAFFFFLRQIGDDGFGNKNH